MGEGMSIGALIRGMASAGATLEAILMAVDAVEAAELKDVERKAKRAAQKAKERNVARQGSDKVATVGATVGATKAPPFPPDGPPYEIINSTPPLTPHSPENSQASLARPRTEKPQKRRSQILEDAEPTGRDLEFAAHAGLLENDCNSEWSQFVDHHLKTGATMSDWGAAWRTWVRNCIKYRARAGPAYRPRSNGTRGLIDLINQDIRADEQREKKNAGNCETADNTGSEEAVDANVSRIPTIRR